MSEINESEKLIVCGDLNARVDVNADGFGMVHGGNIYIYIYYQIVQICTTVQNKQ